MAVLTEAEELEIRRRFDELLSVCLRVQTEEDRNTVIRAFELAHEAHKEMKRKSGEPYIHHPIAVAK